MAHRRFLDSPSTARCHVIRSYDQADIEENLRDRDEAFSSLVVQQPSSARGFAKPWDRRR